MTCRYSDTDWRDVLYTSVCKTSGGVSDAADYLTRRRGKSISAESLRKRLRHVDGESISLEMAELLTEWMEEKAQATRLDWLHCLNARFGLTAAPVGTTELEQDLQNTFIAKTAIFGGLAQEIAQALADGKITKHEADKIISSAQANQRASQEIIEATRRAVGKAGK